MKVVSWGMKLVNTVSNTRESRPYCGNFNALNKINNEGKSLLILS
jgi:hypothetical protein